MAEPLSVEAAQTGILQRLSSPVSAPDNLPLEQALHKVLAADIIAPINVPPFRNAAMDGYAVISSHLPGSGIAELKIAGAAYAGQPYNTILKPGECVRIMTGAPLPENADSVVIQENVEINGDVIRFELPIKSGANVRAAGEDIAKDQRILDKGKRLGAADLGALASLGLATVPVYPDIRVGFFTSGDELNTPGDVLPPGGIYNSNRYMLAGLLQRPGIDAHYLGILPDEPQALAEKLQEAAQNADLIITTGGVSVGDRDFITDVLRDKGQLEFWKIAMKPGKPLAFGRYADTWFFGLPGNPVSAYVTFQIIVLPALRRLMGETRLLPSTLNARTTQALKKKPGRADYQRGILGRDANGRLVVEAAGRQDSHCLSGVCGSDCYIVLPAETGNIAAGETVTIIPFSEFL